MTVESFTATKIVCITKPHEKWVRLSDYDAVERQNDKNESYFCSICEALGIDHEASLTEILVAIDRIKTKSVIEWYDEIDNRFGNTEPYEILSIADINDEISKLRDKKDA